MAADDVIEPPAADDVDATAHDGDAALGTDPDGEAEPVPGDGEPTVLDVLIAAHDSVSTMIEAITSDTTGEQDMDALLARARSMLSLCDSGEKCPMCAGEGTLAAEPAPDPRSERCTDCGGVGKVYTGSLVPESAVRPCGKCAGAGFTERASVTPLPTHDYTQAPPPAGAQWYDEADPGTWHLPIDPAKRGQTVGG